MPRVPFPTSYAACRDDFRESAEHAGAAATGTPITATGPDGLGLTIDVAVLGPPSPERALFVMAGVHGVEGFTGSPIMCHALSRWGERDLPHVVGIVFVHAVNPWGMAWLRRQNEPNVDLNRNWAAGTTQGTDDNPGYATLHDILCRSARRRRHRSRSWTRRRASSRGEEWVRAAVSDGQSTHPDGLSFTGDRTEESTVAVADLATRHLAAAHDVVVVDLHTGHGADGDMTLLARHALDPPGDRWTRSAFPGTAVVSTVRAGAHHGAAGSRADWPTRRRRPPSTP